MTPSHAQQAIGISKRRCRPYLASEIISDANDRSLVGSDDEIGPQTVYDLRQQHTSEARASRKAHVQEGSRAISSLVGAESTGKEKATRQTNNTGELTALLHALHRAARRGRRRPRGAAVGTRYGDRSAPPWVYKVLRARQNQHKRIAESASGKRKG